jgi:small subunit ribosomal protein S13
MIYILGTNLKNTQRVWRSLCKVHGINGVLSGQICDDLGISRQVRISQLLPSQIDLLNQIVPQHYLTGAELQTQVRKNRERLIAISTYRGIRHSQGLPTRGQRTHGNAQTSRRWVLRRSRSLQQKETYLKRKKR